MSVWGLGLRVWDGGKEVGGVGAGTLGNVIYCRGMKKKVLGAGVTVCFVGLGDC